MVYDPRKWQLTIQSPEMLDKTKIQLPAVLGGGGLEGGAVLLEELVFTLLKI